MRRINMGKKNQKKENKGEGGATDMNIRIGGKKKCLDVNRRKKNSLTNSY